MTRYKIILSVVLFGLGVGIIFWPKQQPTHALTLLALEHINALHDIEIHRHRENADDTLLLFDKTPGDDEWEMRKPIWGPPDKDTLNIFLKKLNAPIQQLEQDDIVGSGLDASTLNITLRGDFGEVNLRFGNTNPLSSRVYARICRSTDNDCITALVHKDLTKLAHLGITQWRRRQLLPSALNEVRTIVYKGRDSLERSGIGEPWHRAGHTPIPGHGGPRHEVGEVGDTGARTQNAAINAELSRFRALSFRTHANADEVAQGIPEFSFIDFKGRRTDMWRALTPEKSTWAVRFWFGPARLLSPLHAGAWERLVSLLNDAELSR